MRDLASAIGRVAPTAHVLVISNPVNSTVPIVASTLAKAGVYDPRRVFGVTTLDVVRAARFCASIAGVQPHEMPVTVVGGHSGTTIVPLISQSPHGHAIKGEAYAKVVHRIQFGGDEVVQAKDGAGSATLSMAYAGAKFTNALLRALSGEKGVVTPTFVDSPLYKSQGIDFFASNVELGVSVMFLRARRWTDERVEQVNGVERIHSLGEMTEEEKKLLEACLPELKKNIEKGRAFVEMQS